MTTQDVLPLLSVVGPTASGKTELALRLAETLDGEVINADSVQVYRHFDIGSGKASKEELARAPHHLLGYLDPLDAVDAASWAEAAHLAIGEIRARGRVPILCGGTFLWVRALHYGLAAAPPADARLRAEHQRLVEAEGRGALHERLAAVDPEAAARLNGNDFVRVSRALEVFELTGRPISEWQRDHGFAEARHAPLLVGVHYTPEELTERITRRVAGMFAAGWVEEVRRLRAEGYGQARAMGAVGYRQVHEALEGSEAPDLLPLQEEIVRATRIYARRQRTWLAKEPVHWLNPEQVADGAQALPAAYLQRLTEHLV